MRVLVCGGRDFEDRQTVFDVLDCIHKPHPSYSPTIDLIIHGGASGADHFAALWADSRGVDVGCWKAKWREHGRAAGPIRNQQMLVEGRPDLIVAFPGGKGTADMVERGRRAHVTIKEVRATEHQSNARGAETETKDG